MDTRLRCNKINYLKYKWYTIPMSVANDKKIALEIANKIKEARISKNLTQEDVAKKAGINTNSYAKIERGVQKPKVLTLTKILKALEIKSSKILSI